MITEKELVERAPLPSLTPLSDWLEENWTEDNWYPGIYDDLRSPSLHQKHCINYALHYRLDSPVYQNWYRNEDSYSVTVPLVDWNNRSGRTAAIAALREWELTGSIPSLTGKEA